jgi:small multidrug resistance pump
MRGASFSGSVYPNPPVGSCLLSVFYLATAIILEICGTTSLKLSDGFTRIGPAGAVVVCYAASFALLSLALRGIDLSVAYAIWSGVGTAIVAAVGIVWFGEPAEEWKLLSLALIVLGVAGLHLSARAS